MKRVLLLMLVAAPALAQPWSDAYNRGVAAVQAKKYAAAAEALQAAIREMPSESAKLRTNREFITYLPHMWLGIARAGLGEADAALAEFRISEEQGVVQSTPFYAQMKEWVGQAQQQKKRAAENAAGPSRREANAAIGRAVGAQSDALVAGAGRGDPLFKSAAQKLQEATDAFQHAGADVRAYNHAGELAREAREGFAAAAEEAKNKPAPQPKPAPKEFVVPFDEPPPKKVVITNTTVTPPAPVPVPVPVPVPAPPVVSEALASARIAVQSYKRKLIEAHQPAVDAMQFERALAGTPDEQTIARVVAQVAEHQRRLEAKLHPPPPVPVPAPAPAPVVVDTRADLEAAYRAFAGGDFAASETLLTNAITKSATAEAYALRACTRYTRAMLARNASALLASAADDFRAALRLNAALRLDDGAFSPKLVKFFEDVRGGAQ